MAKLTLLVLAFSVLSPCVRAQSTIIVSPTCSQTTENGNLSEFRCLDLNRALNNMSSNTSLLLEPCTHTIIARQPQQLETRLSNITITGAGVGETVVTCEDGYGLEFVGVRNLKLSGFTVVNCGLANDFSLLSLLISKFSIDFFFSFPQTSSGTKVAMLIGNCENVIMEDIHITNTTGIGLLGINVIGSSILNRVNFTRNIRPLCLNNLESNINNPLYFSQIGGGAYFVFFDFTDESSNTDSAILNVTNSYFAHNADCTSSAFISVSHLPFDFNQLIHSLGAGGGLSLIVASSNMEITVYVTDTIFYQNDARYGGGAYVATFAESQHDTIVQFINCTFLENGVITSEGIQQSQCQGGGGLAIFLGLTKLEYLEGEVSVSFPQGIVVNQCTFTQNHAEIQGGGVMAYSLFYSATLERLAGWIFSESRFVGNSARFSSALHVADFSGSALIKIQIEESIVQNNFGQPNGDVDEDDAAVLLQEVVCVIIGSVQFSHNVGSALRIENADINVFESTITFDQNLAHRGGAIYFSGETSKITLSSTSRLKFTENQAVTEGGALYAAPQSPQLAILRPESVDTTDCFMTNFENGIFNLSFSGNRAPLGSIFFGPSQENCDWAADYMMHEQNLFNSLPTSVAATLGNASNDTVFPGQAVDIKILVSDAYNQIIPALVSSVVGSRNNTRQASATLGSSGFWHTSVNGSQLTVTSSNYTEPITVSIVAVQNSKSTTITVNLVPCPLGFLSDESNPRCTCHKTLANSSEILCLEDLVGFITRERVWIGVDPAISEPTTNDLVIHNCILNYCKAFGNNNIVIPPQFDSQCDFNRAGFLCGDCAEGYSHVFGTNECHRCENVWLILIPSFAIAGGVLFSGIALLEITIDKGLTNVVIFFGSVVSLFDFLGPSEINFSYSFLPIRLLALQLGVTTCFYDGMTTLARSTLQFLFPAYLFVLMGIFTLLSQRFTWMSVHFSPAKTLATLTVMCYLSVLSTTVDILIPIRVESIAGETSYRWFFDPGVKYFTGGHAARAVFAILTILLYIIPAPLFFLCPSLAYKYIKLFTPFWDILWAAYKPKFRFWLGIRIFLIITSFPVTRIPLSYAYIVSTTIDLVFIVIEALIQPFKDKWANYADIVLLTSISLYIRRIQTLSEDQPSSGTAIAVISYIYLAILILVIYTVYILLFVLLIHRQFSSLGPKLRQVILCKKELQPATEPVLTDRCTATSTTVELGSYVPPPISQHKSEPLPDATGYRDSILEIMDKRN